MKTASRDAGGAIVVVAIVFTVMILLILGGGFFFLVSYQRVAAHEMLQRALAEEHLAIALAKEQQVSPLQEKAIAKQALAEARSSANTTLVDEKDVDATPAGDAEPADGKSTALSQLGWLVNHWQHVDGERSSEEHWIAPRGGIMLGVNRSINGKGKTSFEYLRIESNQDGRMVYFASPMWRGETAFSLLEIGKDRVVFENPEHDFPQRIIYWLDDQRRLHARIEGEIGGKPRQSEWTWSAQR